MRSGGNADRRWVRQSDRSGIETGGRNDSAGGASAACASYAPGYHRICAAGKRRRELLLCTSVQLHRGRGDLDHNLSVDRNRCRSGDTGIRHRSRRYGHLIRNRDGSRRRVKASSGDVPARDPDATGAGQAPRDRRVSATGNRCRELLLCSGVDGHRRWGEGHHNRSGCGQTKTQQRAKNAQDDRRFPAPTHGSPRFLAQLGQPHRQSSASARKYKFPVEKRSLCRRGFNYPP